MVMQHLREDRRKEQEEGDEGEEAEGEEGERWAGAHRGEDQGDATWGKTVSENFSDAG